MEYLPYIGGGLVTLLGLLGIGKLLQMAYREKLDRKKVKHDLDQANGGKLIDADLEALRMFRDRLTQVEQEGKARDEKHDNEIRVLNEKFEKLKEAHTLLMLENEKAKSDAHHAETEMARQATEILGLRKRNHDLGDEIMKRDAKLALLEGRILHLESLLVQYQTGRATDIATAHAAGMKEEHEIHDTPIKVQMVDSPVPVTIEDYNVKK